MLLEEDPFVGDPVPRGKDKDFSLIHYFAMKMFVEIKFDLFHLLDLWKW